MRRAIAVTVTAASEKAASVTAASVTAASVTAFSATAASVTAFSATAASATAASATAASVPAASPAVLTSSQARVPGHPPRGLRARVRLVLVPPVRVAPALDRVLRAPAHDRATTRSARPRPVWGRRRRPGLRLRARPATVATVTVRAARAPAAPAAPAPRAPVAVAPVVRVRACPTAARVPAGSPAVARVLVARGRAR